MRAREQKRRGKQRPLKRRLHFGGGEVWTYRVGNGLVLVRPPDLHTTYHVSLTEITGMSWDDLERGQWKGWWSGMGPQEVKDYIDRHLRPPPEIVVPRVVFVHPTPWVAQTWHLRPNCHFLPQTRRGQAYDAIGLGPDRARRHLGGELNRRNLCGICMRHAGEERGGVLP